MNIALVSLDQLWEDKEANVSLCEAYIKEASQKAVELIIFPEMTLTGFSSNISKIAEEKSTSETVRKFSQLAKQYNIALLLGVVFQDGEKATNNSIVIDEKGDLVGTYTKIHPFTFAKEDLCYNGGNSIETCTYKDITIGLTICYDLRFPELYSILAKSCDLIVNIANWPAKRVCHWSTLLKARAIENQTFIAGVNRVGVDGNSLEYCKCSEIINANGDSLEATSSWKDMDVYTVDTLFTSKFQELFNTYRDRKTSLYKQYMLEG